MAINHNLLAEECQRPQVEWPSGAWASVWEKLRLGQNNRPESHCPEISRATGKL